MHPFSDSLHWRLRPLLPLWYTQHQQTRRQWMTTSICFALFSLAKMPFYLRRYGVCVRVHVCLCVCVLAMIMCVCALCFCCAYTAADTSTVDDDIQVLRAFFHWLKCHTCTCTRNHARTHTHTHTKDVRTRTHIIMSKLTITLR